MKRTPLKRKSRLNPVSKKRRKDLSTYSLLRKGFLSKFSVCFVCVNKQATDIHHMNGRHNARLNDITYWLPLCRQCHDWIHTNPKQARDEGYLI